MTASARDIIQRFDLQPHPEGGHYREIYRSPLRAPHPALPAGKSRDRSASTAIYFLVEAGDFSAFHRVVPSDEIWHLYAGGPLELHLIHENGRYEKKFLTPDPATGEPALIVPAGCWQAARPAPGAAWCFGGCTVAPGFDFADFEMPGRDVLTRLFPQHAKIIGALTRDRGSRP